MTNSNLNNKNENLEGNTEMVIISSKSTIVESNVKETNDNEVQDTDSENYFFARGGKCKKDGTKSRFHTNFKRQEEYGYENKEISQELFIEYYKLSGKNFIYENLLPYKKYIFLSKKNDDIFLLIDKRNPTYNINNSDFYLCPEGHTDALTLASCGYDKDYGILIRSNLKTLPIIPKGAKRILFIRDKEESESDLKNKMFTKYTDQELSGIEILTIGSEILGSYDISEFIENSILESHEDIMKQILEKAKEIKVSERPISLFKLVESSIEKTKSDIKKPIKSSLVTELLELLFEWRKNEVTTFIEVRLNPNLWNILNFERKEYWSDKLPFEFEQLSEAILFSIELFVSESLELLYNRAFNIDKLVNKCINSLSKKRKYNPLKDYFFSLIPINPAEGNHPVKELFNCLTIHPDYIKLEPDLIDIFCYFLGMTIKCALEEYPNELMPILTGGQGAGKTKFMRALIPKQIKKYTSNRIDKTKDGYISITRNFLIIDDELENLKQSNIEQLKSRLSAIDLSERLLYDKYEVQLKRVASFIGATNIIDFLKDTTGNRRFMPIPVIKCENEEQHYKNMEKIMNFDTDSLWAVGLYYYQNKKDLFINEAQLKRINEINCNFTVTDIYEQGIVEYLVSSESTIESEASFMTPKMILEKFASKSSINAFSNDTYGTSNLGKALNKLGYNRKQKRVDKKYPEYGYYVVFK
ncbi:MAG: hypothetical protein CVV25_13190 [Ignavibacteriae bacterium HGW-Ignavibacteriae-4]|jgi:hypothetical protein|nr:MAG: hypothetical protein CVV25_13190 [Ignavibacteriae bacterium HGW-Ignavibacteriae-4]